MHIDLAALPDDVTTLHRMIGELATALDGERVRAQAEIARLRQIVTALQRSRFGRRSERLDDDQLQLGLEDVDADIARAEAAIPPLPGQASAVPPPSAERVGLPAHLPRADITVDVADLAVCPCCGGAVHQIGETVSEMLDYVPARLRVLRIRRPKYGCRSCGTIHQAPALRQLIEHRAAWRTAAAVPLSRTFVDLRHRRSISCRRQRPCKAQ